MQMTPSHSTKSISFVVVFVLMAVVLSSVLAQKHRTTDPYAKWYLGKRPIPRKLSKWKLFQRPFDKLQPAARWVPFDINVPLFSDYATKHRMIWMPPGKAAQYDEREVFRMPVGTIIAKTFQFPYKQGNVENAGLIETRLLVHVKYGDQPSEWIGLPYVWNRKQTEAYLRVAGGARIIPAKQSPTKSQFIYVIPNANECVTCHEKDKVTIPIGPKARNLNKLFAYSTGTENQLEHWKKAGYLDGLPPLPKVPKTPNWDSYKPGKFQPELARAYLDTNCAHCHQQGSFASSSALLLNYWITDPTTIGICKEPIAAGKASGGFTYDIVPGEPGQSIMFFRVHSVDAAIRMPELGRTLVHAEGLSLLGTWMAGLRVNGKKGCSGNSPSAASAAPAATAPKTSPAPRSR